MLAHDLQMKEFVTFHELDNKLNAHKIDIDGNTVKRVKTFQLTMNDIVQHKLDQAEFKKAIKEKVNMDEYYHLLK
jgi:wyosine [tRNA(Phe)-imidazoG37] synthetase (radical SAM superfamily)